MASKLLILSAGLLLIAGVIAAIDPERGNNLPQTRLVGNAW
ncbi:MULTISPECIES: hypothetical protein [Filomicrobium]|nr:MULTISPECIES: hypothetical protein [Filomicrobium]